MFRGPRRDLELPFVVALGGTETYGKFVPEPFPNLLEADTGLRIINMGCMNAGIDVYLKDPDILNVAGRARVAVVQVMGAQNLSNRFYSVHPRRNDRFLYASPLLRTIFREVDFTEFNFTGHMLQALQAVSVDKFEVLAEELRAAWVARMKALLAALPCKTVLLWMSETPPPMPGRRADLTRNPMMVDAEMIDAIRPQTTAFVEAVVSAAAQPCRAEAAATAEFDAPAVQNLPGPAAHRDVAALLAPVLLELA